MFTHLLSMYRFWGPCLGRKWKYNEDVEEFFVEDETTVKLKRADLTRQTETTEMDDRVLVISFFFTLKNISVSLGL